MKISVVVNFKLNGDFVKPEYADLQASDLTGIIATPVAQGIAVLLGDRSPYSAYGIADVASENDDETLVFTVDTGYFDKIGNYSKEDDFELLWDAFMADSRMEDFVTESTAAYEIEDELESEIRKGEKAIRKYFKDDECFMDVESKGHKIKGVDEYGYGQADGLIYKYTVTIE